MRTRVLILAAILLSALVILPTDGAEADDGFLVGTQYGDNWMKETYSDGVIRLNTPFPTYLESGIWTPINTTIVPSEDENYTWSVIRGRYHAFFRERVLSQGSGQNSHAVKFMVDENWITFRPDALFYREETGPPEQVAGPADISGAPTDSSFLYPNVFQGLDVGLLYEYGTTQLKETFIINSPLPAPSSPTPSTNLSFDLLFFYTPETVPFADGIQWDERSRVQATNVSFLNLTTDEMVYSLVSPFAQDSQGNTTNLIYEMDWDPPRLKLRIVVPYSWLQTASYPVHVDPSLTIQPSEIDSYMERAFPDTNYGTLQSFYVDCSVDSTYRAILQFNISGIPEGATISSATIGLYKYATVGSFPRTYLAKRVTASWSETVITWNNQPAVSDTNQGTATMQSASGWYNWTITQIVTDWHDGTYSNYGVRINDSDETIPDFGPSSAFRSREASQTTERPRLTVEYTIGYPSPFSPAWLTISYFNGFGGLGIPFSTFETYYENTTGSHRVQFVPFPINASQTINITTFDYFGNEISREDSFTIGAEGTYSYIDIAINIADVYLEFSDGEQHLHEFNDLDSGKTTLGYSIPTPLFADHNYSYEVFEDDQIAAISETNLPDLNAAIHVIEVNVTLKDVEIRYSLFDSATGEGMPFTTFPIYADYVRLRTPFYFTRTNSSVNTAVRDFFGNEIYNQTQSADTDPYFWDIGLTVYSWKLTNADLYDYTLSNLTYNGSGVGRAEFVGAGETIAYWLRSGDYTLNLTYYELAVLTGTESVYFSISSAQAYTVTGNRSIQRIVADVGNVGDNILDAWNRGNQTWDRLGELSTPAGIAIVYDSYYVPDWTTLPLLSKRFSAGQVIDPYRTLIYRIVNTSQGSDLYLYRPYSLGWPDDDVNALVDDLFVTPLTSITRMWINNTQDTDSEADDTIILNITYTGYFDMTAYGDGLNLSIETTGGSVNATRVSQVKYISAFLWSQDTTTAQWTMTTNVENGLSLDWSNVNIYLAFPQTIDVDPSTVVLRDVTASVDLEKGIHYDLSDGGVYLALTSLSSGDGNTYRVTFFQRTIGTNILEPRCSIGLITIQRRGITDMNRAEAICVNEASFQYNGRIVFVFDLAKPVDRQSVMVEDTSGNRVPYPMYWNDERTLILTGVQIASLSSLNLVLWFTYEGEVVTPQIVLPFLPHLTIILGIGAAISFWFWGRAPKGTDRKERARVATILLGIVAIIIAVLWVWLEMALVS